MFTVVTVIFLPLSTVASILGMNTNDVRNMEINQWVFWVVAVPLTLIVAAICLVATGELRNFMANLVGLWLQRGALFGNYQRWTVVRDRDSGEDDDYRVLETKKRRRARRRRVSVY